MSDIQVVVDWPPNIEAIREVLPVKEGNIFAHGGRIYDPAGRLTPADHHLFDHEQVHFEQQTALGVNKWWELFLASPEFRLDQEIEAHVAEWRSFQRHNRDRNDRSRHLMVMARRLAAPMYGGIISVGDAKKAILRGRL